MRLRPKLLTFAIVTMLIFVASTSTAKADETPDNGKSRIIKVEEATSEDFPTGEVTFGGSDASTSSDESGASAATPWVCTVTASDVSSNGYTIARATGTQFCSGSGYMPIKVKISIQQQRWYGWASVLTQSTPYLNTGGVEAVARYDCAGDGADVYRALVTGYAKGGANSKTVQSSNYITIICPD